MLDLDAIEALLDWQKDDDRIDQLERENKLHNAAPALIAELRELRAELAQIKSIRLCRQCAMAASFMVGGGDGGVA